MHPHAESNRPDELSSLNFDVAQESLEEVVSYTLPRSCDLRDANQIPAAMPDTPIVLVGSYAFPSRMAIFLRGAILSFVSSTEDISALISAIVEAVRRKPYRNAERVNPGPHLLEQQPPANPAQELTRLDVSFVKLPAKWTSCR